MCAYIHYDSIMYQHPIKNTENRIIFNWYKLSYNFIQFFVPSISPGSNDD